MRHFLSPSCQPASPVFSSHYHNVVPLRALVPISGGYHRTRGDNVLGAGRGVDRARPDGRVTLPTPHQTHAGQRPAPTSAHPLAQEVRQPWRALPRKSGSGTAIEGNRRHTPAGATLPSGSVPLQGIPVMVHEHMATHRSPSSPCLSCRWPTRSHRDLALFWARRQPSEILWLMPLEPTGSHGRCALACCHVSGHSTSRGSLAALPRSWYRRA